MTDFIKQKLPFLTDDNNTHIFISQGGLKKPIQLFTTYDGNFSKLKGAIQITYLALHNGSRQTYRPGGLTPEKVELMGNQDTNQDTETDNLGSITIADGVTTDDNGFTTLNKKPKKQSKIVRPSWSRDYYRYRLHPSKVDGDNKYYTEPKSGTHIYWTIGCIEACAAGQEVDTLHIIEGEFKAYIAHTLYGLKHIAAVAGIWGFTNGDRERDPITGIPKGKHTLHDDIVEFIRQCNVKRVVFIQDADCFDIHYNEAVPDKELSNRPTLFSKSVQTFADLLRPLDVELIFAHVNPSQPHKGLDDLLLASSKDDAAQIIDAINNRETCQYITFHYVATYNTFQFQKLWSIDNLRSFFKKHSAVLNGKPFSFKGKIYKLDVNDGEEIPENVKGGPANWEVPTGANPHDFKTYGLWVQDNRYYALGDKDREKPISNFLLRVLYHVRTGDEKSYRLIEITNVFQHKAVIKVDTDDFISQGGFKKTIARAGNFIWKGTEGQLANLQEKLQHDEVATEFVRTLGWHDKAQAYFWANGMYDVVAKEFKPVDEYGIIRHNDKNYFIPAMSSMFEGKEAMYLNEKAFIYQHSTVTIDEWVNLFCKVFGPNGHIAFVYFVACTFRDVVFDGMRNRFPILNTYGKRGSGKGTLVERLMKLYGKGQVQVMLGGSSTAVGFMRKFAQFKNSVVWLDEYKNNLKVKVIESLKNIYDGVGYERGKMTNDFETESTPILSGCVLSGQEMPTIEPALYSRVIMLTFRETTRTEKQKKLFLDLISMEKKGISHLTCQLLNMRQLFEADYRTTHDECVVQFSKVVNNEDIDERFIQSYAFLLATLKLINKANIVKLPFTEAEFITNLHQNLTNQFMVMQGSDDVSKFWEVVEQLAHTVPTPTIKEGTHYMLKDGILWVRLQLISGIYEKEMRSKGDNNVLSKATLEQYLCSDAQRFVAKDKKSFPDGSYTHAIGFKYTLLGIDLIRHDDPQQRLLKRIEMGEELNDEDVNLYFQHNVYNQPKYAHVLQDLVKQYQAQHGKEPIVVLQQSSLPLNTKQDEFITPDF